MVTSTKKPADRGQALMGQLCTDFHGWALQNMLELDGIIRIPDVVLSTQEKAQVHGPQLNVLDRRVASTGAVTRYIIAV